MLAATDPRGPEVGARASSWTLALVALFVLACLPLCADLARYHGDERFYTDAALRMVRDGGWLTPRYADGVDRLNKPLLSYWLIAASAKVFGFHAWSARLPFVLAGALALLFTARAARLVTGDPRAGFLAAAILASSAEFLALATRSTPDVLVIAAIGAATCGAAELAFDAAPARGAVWRLWCGAGAALLAKGALGLLAPFFGLAWIATRRGRAGLARSFATAPLVAFALLACATVAPLLLAREGAGLARAYDDQVGTRAAASLAVVLDNLVTYLSSLVRHLLPWTVVALAALLLARDRARAWWRERAGPIAFALAWYGVLLAVFSLANLQRGRYLAPAYPLVAALLAACVLESSARARAEKLVRAASFGLALLGACAALALAWIAWRVELPATSALLAAAVTGAAVVIAARTQRSAALAATASIAIALPLGERALRAVFDSAPVDALRTRLAELHVHGAELALVGAEHGLAGQLRWTSGGELTPVEIEVRELETDRHAIPASTRWLVLAPEVDLGAVERTLGERAVLAREDCGADPPRWSARAVLDVVRAADPCAEHARRARPYRLWRLAELVEPGERAPDGR